MRRGTAEAVEQSASATSDPVRSVVKRRFRRLRELDVPQQTVERFRRACRQKTAYLVRTVSSEADEGILPVLWDRPSLIVGRGADCDLRLPHAEISRQHAYFQIIGERIHCADLGSRTGTHWSNGASQAGWIEPNEPVSLGPYSLTFERVPLPADAEPHDAELADEAPPDLADSDGDDALPDQGDELFLHFVNAGRKVRRYRVNRDITLIGSSEGVKIQLTHPSVSNVHCSVVRTHSGLWIVDLLSSDGTIVNGHIEPLAALRPGDEFQVGRFLVVVHRGECDDIEPVPVISRTQVRAATAPLMPKEPESTNAAPPDQDPDRDAGRLSALSQLARLTASGPNANGGIAPLEGLSEQFVLNIIRELGVMQQQALQHAQESMRETVQQLSLNYQQRIDTLERQHASLRDRLYEMTVSRNGRQLAGPLSVDEDAVRGPALSSATVEGRPAEGGAIDFTDRSAEAPPEVSDGMDPADREQWIREQIKAVEQELDKARRGWGRRLVDLLGY